MLQLTSTFCLSFVGILFNVSSFLNLFWRIPVTNHHFFAHFSLKMN